MWFNQMKTLILLTVLSALFIALGYAFGGVAGLQIAFLFALIMNGVTYFFSDKIVLALYRAKPLDRHTHSDIFTMVQELARSMHLPMPKLWIIDTNMANAFATGRSPSHASIAVTTGLLQILDDHELRGVLAHELGHVKNRDILIVTIAATLAMAIGYLASMLQHMALWGAMSDSADRRRGNPIILFLVALLMPIAATLIQLAISRSREYLADESGAHYSHDPLALASALDKIHKNVRLTHLSEQETEKASTAPLFIIHPFLGKSLLALFSTHPPVEKRIARLRSMYEKKSR